MKDRSKVKSQKTKVENSGLVYVFTGEGKGKTSAALGVAIRAIGNDMKVGWVAWYKQASWGLSDANVPTLVGEDKIQMFFLGEGFHISTTQNSKLKNKKSNIKVRSVGRDGQVVVDIASEHEHKHAAKSALEMARKLMSEVDVLVLDEINNAVDDKLLDQAELIELLSTRKKTHVVLTGRNAAAEIVQVADLVTEMKKVKHPYDQGKLAVKGLDF